MLNNNQKEIYDIIMNDEPSYILYRDKDFRKAIENAIGMANEYGYPIALDSDEKEELIAYLKEELKEI